MKKEMVLMSLLSALFMSGAQAQSPEGRGGKMLRAPEGGGPGAALRLGWALNDSEALKKSGLTDEQITALRGAVYAHKEQAIALRAERDKARLALDKLMNSDSPSEDALMKAVENVGAAEISMQKEQIKLQMKAMEIMGKEKYQKIRTIQQNMFKQGREGQERRPRPEGRMPPPPEPEEQD